jgi:VIT1/CCC1 family predicted Fe2+/Mn2+ transporter
MEIQKDFWKHKLKEWTSLDKPARLSEVLFGLIMVLTFTGTVSASDAGKDDISELLWAALGCNLAWGLVDAIMYLMDDIVGRARNINQLIKIRQAEPADVSRVIVRDSISPLIADLMNDVEIDRLSEKIKQLPVPTLKNALTIKDILIAGQIFLLVFLSTFPVALPFIFFNEVVVAMRVSNGVALLLLFTAGFALARYSGLRPFITALIYTAIGVFLVVLTIILGG